MQRLIAATKLVLFTPPILLLIGVFVVLAALTCVVLFAVAVLLYFAVGET
jgi:hypothetical protein